MVGGHDFLSLRSQNLLSMCLKESSAVEGCYVESEPSNHPRHVGNHQTRLKADPTRTTEYRKKRRRMSVLWGSTCQADQFQFVMPSTWVLCVPPRAPI